MNPLMLTSNERRILSRGTVLPAMPLALNGQRKLDERRQRALCRYYLEAGSGGLAVGVHTTQFAIRDPKHALLRPVLTLAAEEAKSFESTKGQTVLRIAGVCGTTAQAVKEAELARDLGYQAGLLSLAALTRESIEDLIRHCEAVAEVLPLVGFYLQTAVGGRTLPYRFWRRFAEIPGVVAIKIAPFNRYQTWDVVRAIAETGRTDIALYTGNDDHIVLDLLTPHRVRVGDQWVEQRIVGGLLGHWSVWTRSAVELLKECHELVDQGGDIPWTMLAKATEVTDCNAAFFDAANGFGGCIAGLHEVLRRQGLLEGVWLLDENETFGQGQLEEIDRVLRDYSPWADDAFVAENLDRWLGG